MQERGPELMSDIEVLCLEEIKRMQPGASGLAILTAVKERVNGPRGGPDWWLRGPGFLTVFNALEKLRASGCVESYPIPDMQTFYRLTDEGEARVSSAEARSGQTESP